MAETNAKLSVDPVQVQHQESVTTPRLSMELDTDQLLSDLSRHVRVTTAEILAGVAWCDAQDPLGSAAQWARRQSARGLLSVETMMAHPPLGHSEPLLEWSSGMNEPNFGRLAHLAKSRYSKLLKPTVVVMATEGAKRRYGGGLPRRPVLSRQLDHDIGVSEVFFHLLQHRPELAADWTHEDAPSFPLPYWRGEKIPDAVICNSEPTVIEFAGRYSAKKLREIHHAFGEHHYMLW